MQNQTADRDKRVGEVIGADSRFITAQCYRLNQAPPLGALALVGDPATFVVVASVRTEPLDPSRPVLARGENAASLEEVYRDNPQIERLFTTRFEAVIVGYAATGQLRQLLPPVPPPIHSFVQTGTPEVTAAFTENLDFLRFLLNAGLPHADEVVAACLREGAASRTDRESFVVRAGRALAAELSGESARLSAILRRVRL